LSQAFEITQQYAIFLAAAGEGGLEKPTPEGNS